MPQTFTEGRASIETAGCLATAQLAGQIFGCTSLDQLKPLEPLAKAARLEAVAEKFNVAGMQKFNVAQADDAKVQSGGKAPSTTRTI